MVLQLDDETAAKSFICQSCWTKVLAFHDFYEEVWAAHTVKVELFDNQSENDDRKQVKHDELTNDAAESDQDGLDCNEESSTSSIHDTRAEPVKRGRGRPRKETRLSSVPRRSSTVQPIAKYFTMKCTQCETVFRDLLDARTHYKEQHNTSGYLLCCDKKFYRRKAISDHFRFHEDISEHK